MSQVSLGPGLLTSAFPEEKSEPTLQVFFFGPGRSLVLPLARPPNFLCTLFPLNKLKMLDLPGYW